MSDDRNADVAGFFDHHAESYYRERSEGMTPYHALTAARIEDGLSGRVAAIGGLWAAADRSRCLDFDLTIVDVSERMLEPLSAEGFTTSVGDARATSFEDESLDHLVFPLVLHHITDGGFRNAYRQLNEVMREAHRILRPGGHLWISDFVVSNTVYALEGIAAPVTKRLIGLANIPLVVMHSEWAFLRAIRKSGFTSRQTFFPQPSLQSRFVRPVIGLDWLNVPRALYPIRPALITGRRTS